MIGRVQPLKKKYGNLAIWDNMDKFGEHYAK